MTASTNAKAAPTSPMTASTNAKAAPTSPMTASTNAKAAPTSGMTDLVIPDVGLDQRQGGADIADDGLD
jgi:hypothetical protein